MVSGRVSCKLLSVGNFVVVTENPGAHPHCVPIECRLALIPPHKLLCIEWFDDRLAQHRSLGWRIGGCSGIVFAKRKINSATIDLFVTGTRGRICADAKRT